MAMNTDEFLTRRDLARMFKVTEPTIIRWEKEKKFPALRLGFRVRYRRVDIEQFLKACQN